MQMTALSNARNTTEILCHTQKLHRTRTVKDNTKIYTGSMVAINGSTNKAEPAADAAGLIVIGRAEGFYRRRQSNRQKRRIQIRQCLRHGGKTDPCGHQ